MQRLRIGCVLGLALALLAGCGEAQPPQDVLNQHAKSTDLPQNKPLDRLSTEIYEFKINNHTLRAPMNYIGDVSPDNKFASLDVEWPGMEGRKPGVKRDLLDYVPILLSGRNHIKEAPLSPVEDRIGRPSQGSPIGFDDMGLIGFPYAGKPGRIDIYVPQDKSIKKSNGQRLFIACQGVETWRDKPGSVECQVSDYIRDDVMLTYRFYEKHIRHWAEIDKEVHSFVESLFQEK